MTDTQAVTGQYLEQSRLIRTNPAPEPFQHHRHAEFLSDVIARLGVEGPATAPELHVVCTANAEVETLNLSGKHVLIFDRDFGAALATLNGFLVGEPQLQAVLGWGLGQLATALALQGEYERAFAALSGSVFLDSVEYPADARSMKRVAHNVLLQEYFAIAHECVHMALADGRLKDFARVYGQIVQAISEQFAEVPASEARGGAHDPLVKFQGEAIRELLMQPADAASNTKYESWLRQQLSLPVSASVLGYARGAMREELTCDAVATELTIQALGGAVGEARVIEAIFHGLSNLLSLEYVRFVGRLAGSQALRDPQQGLPVALQLWVGRMGNILNVLVRRIVWRRWLHARAGNTDATAATLSVLTEHYERRVTSVLKLLPEQFQEGYAGMQSRGQLILNPAIWSKIMRQGGDPDVLLRIVETSNGRLFRY